MEGEQGEEGEGEGWWLAGGWAGSIAVVYRSSGDEGQEEGVGESTELLKL